ncbi:MAG: GNAT family N-acetyltransferase [Candidatus Eremiobacteraeota bacterium]|nr:GNAT family N-acetyltransferase [Candidatus Eremiobacteraeota bacterium]MCW5869089.1 GNAT family N-acetyltransferase [Candidatus Eremiobacteraeota bacterium]
MRLDLDFSRRLEFAEAAFNRACVEIRAPEFGACWMHRAGASATFDAVGSPFSQTFGLGLEEIPDREDFEALENFFFSRGASVYHEVSPLVSPELFAILQRRGYQVCELTNMLWVDLATYTARPQSARIIEPAEANEWAELSAAGWASEEPNLIEFSRSMGKLLANCSFCHCFFAEQEGRAISTGALFVAEDVALLAGASTPPEYRRRGGQSALLQARLGFAKERGCKFAVVGAQPGGRSQINAEAAGFRVAYTRLKWVLRPP